MAGARPVSVDVADAGEAVAVGARSALASIATGEEDRVAAVVDGDAAAVSAVGVGAARRRDARARREDGKERRARLGDTGAAHARLVVGAVGVGSADVHATEAR